MEFETRHYVEEYWIDHLFEGYIKEIASRKKYIKDYMNDSIINSGPIVIRFYDREVINYEGKRYFGNPINYSDFISSYENVENVTATLHPEEGDKEVHFKDIKKLEDYEREEFEEMKNLRLKR